MPQIVSLCIHCRKNRLQSSCSLNKLEFFSSFALWKLKIHDFARILLLSFYKAKKFDLRDAPAAFQGGHKRRSLPRLLTRCHVCAALTLQFMERALSPSRKMLRLPRTCETLHCKVLRLPGEHDALALTRLQSIAPGTQTAKITSRLKKNKHFIRDFLQFSHFRNSKKHLPKLSRRALR